MNSITTTYNPESIRHSKVCSFKQIANGGLLREFTEQMVEKLESKDIALVFAPETMGVPFGAALATALKCGLIMATKINYAGDAASKKIDYIDGSEEAKSLFFMPDLVAPRSRIIIADDYVESGALVRAIFDQLTALRADVVGVACLGVATDFPESSWPCAIHQFEEKPKNRNN